MNSASTQLPCFLLMLGWGSADMGSAQPTWAQLHVPLHWEPKEGAQFLDSRHIGARGMQITPLCTDLGREWGKNREEKGRERTVCPLPGRVNAQTLCDQHIPKTECC